MLGKLFSDFVYIYFSLFMKISLLFVKKIRVIYWIYQFFYNLLTYEFRWALIFKFNRTKIYIKKLLNSRTMQKILILCCLWSFI